LCEQRRTTEFAVSDVVGRHDVSAIAICTLRTCSILLLRASVPHIAENRMSLINILTNFADRLANVVNVARITKGPHSMSPERLAEARRMMLDIPAGTRTIKKVRNCASVPTTTHKAAR
jgi:hypothetical protein